MPAMLSPLAIIKLVLWIAIVIVGTLLLRRRAVTTRARIAFLLGGTLLFGFVFGVLSPAGSLDPNPVFSVRSFVRGLVGAGPLQQAPQQASPVSKPGAALLPIVGMLLVLLGLVWASNKSLCGWGCPLGLLQDLLHHVPLPKWKPSFRLSNTIRIVAFAALVAGLAIAGLDWISVIDPFRIFQLDLSLAIGLFGVLLLVASLFTYRPWCQFLCPFGLMGWVVEQFSLQRPRINRDACRDCQLCVKACPGQAMADIYAGKKLHADCFACGACLNVCPSDDALQWRTSSSPSQE
ncbi:MAG: 4Fe-4S binding protein [Anaerolineae bacterium]|nr:4Fe-4S binding protein [Anaerolineae bacterium]